MKDGIGLGLYTWYEHIFLSWGCQWRCTILSLATGQNTCIYNRAYIYTFMYIIYTVCLYWFILLYILWNIRSPNWYTNTSLLWNTTSPTSWTYSNKQFHLFKKNMFQPCQQHESSNQLIHSSPPPFCLRKCTSSGAEIRFLEISKISSVGQPHSDTCCQSARTCKRQTVKSSCSSMIFPSEKMYKDHLMILLRCIPVPPTPTKKTGNLVPYALFMWIIMYILCVHVIYTYKYINYLHLLQSTPKYVPLKPSITRTLPLPARHNCGAHKWTVLLEAPWKKFIGLTPPFKWMFPKIGGYHPNSSILIRFSIIFTIHFRVPLFLETPKSN